jgi:uncharacterized membrane protein HdeD (DUF308 family)
MQATKELRVLFAILSVVVGFVLIWAGLAANEYSVEHSLQPLIDVTVTEYPYRAYAFPLIVLGVIAVAAGITLYLWPQVKTVDFKGSP